MQISETEVSLPGSTQQVRFTPQRYAVALLRDGEATNHYAWVDKHGCIRFNHDLMVGPAVLFYDFYVAQQRAMALRSVGYSVGVVMVDPCSTTRRKQAA